MPLKNSYITHPQRIYQNPLSPSTSDYDEVIPVTTSDAVIMEGTTTTLTDALKDIQGGVAIDQRNATVMGDDIVKVVSKEGTNIATAANAISGGEYNFNSGYLAYAFDGILDASHMWWSKQLYLGYSAVKLYGYSGSDSNTYLVDADVSSTGSYNYLLSPLPSENWFTKTITVSGDVITLEGGVVLTRDTSADVNEWIGDNYPPYVVSGHAYIGNKNLTEKVTTVRLAQAPYASSAVSSVKVQYSSDNGTTWQDLQTYDTPVQPSYSDFLDLVLPDYTPVFPYALRVLANSDVGGASGRYPCWQVVELELMAGGGGLEVQVGNLTVTIASGFSEKGYPVDATQQKIPYEVIPTPGVNDRFLLLKLDGTYEYVSNFDGGRSFPLNPNGGDVFFNNQLRQAYKYVAGAPGEWTPYPCTAIARFDNGTLAEIFPYNTWWWDEVIYEDIEADIPIGMEISVITDTPNLLKVNEGSVVSKDTYYRLYYPILKDVTQNFAPGTGAGSADGSYTTGVSNLIPTTITPTNNYGFTVLGFTDASSGSLSQNNVWSSLNPNWATGYSRWASAGYPFSATIILPGIEKACIKKYSVSSWGDSNDLSHVCQSWKLFGSNDGNTWELIHYVENAGYTIAQGETKSWVTNSGTSYHSFKIVQLGNNNVPLNSHGSTDMGQIRFYVGAPKLNVFAINNGTQTDILTSIYDAPQLPAGYINFKRLGSVILSAEDTATLVNPYPTVDLSEDFVKGFETLNNRITDCATVDMDNLSEKGYINLGNLVTPNYHATPIHNLAPGVVYKADIPGYIWVTCNMNNPASGGELAIVASRVPDNISGNPGAGYYLWRYNADISANNWRGASVVPIPQGFYYKVIVNGTISFLQSRFTPMVGYYFTNQIWGY